MKTTATRLNPFVLMLDPETVINAMEASVDLRQLRGRVCRPLDKPLIPVVQGNDRQAFDQEIDSQEIELPEEIEAAEVSFEQ